MSTQDKDRERQTAPPDDRSRRAFVALSAAAGWVAASRSSAATAQDTVEPDVEIRTPDGVCDAALIHPVGGAHPGVLIWTDIFGLRPSMREFGHRLAAAGYAVLVPNPFYRTTRAPVLGDISAFSFQKEADRARLPPLTGPLNAAGAAEADARAYLDFLDAQHQVDKTKKIGSQGYCIGGSLGVLTDTSDPDNHCKEGAIHGGGLGSLQP